MPNSITFRARQEKQAGDQTQKSTQARHRFCAATLTLAISLFPGTVSAVDLNRLADQSNFLTSSNPGDLMRAAVAICLYPGLDKSTIATSFRHADWNVSGDGEWTEIDRNDVWVTLMGSNGDFFCDVQGHIPQDAAMGQIRDLIDTTEWAGWTITATDDACRSISHSCGLQIEITSGGNDPTCNPMPDSAIRIYYGAN